MKKVIILSSLLIAFFLYHDASAITTTNTKCKKALTQISNPVFHSPYMVTVFKLSSAINKLTTCEYPLYVSEINSGLIYCAEVKNGNNVTISQEFFFSQYDSITALWDKPINIEKEYPKFCEVNKTMNFQEIFIAINNDIYRVDLKSNTFSPQKLNINTKNIESSPVLSSDGSTLYFISDRKGGYGGSDIWASERSSNGNWIEPYNLGKYINSSLDEESPYLMSDGATLYFSSKGHNSYGGYDIFFTTQNAEGLWSAAEKLGPPVNSTSDDYYYITDSYGNIAYYSSDKMGEGNQDIYIVKYNSLNRIEFKTL
jgi:ribosomal protein L24E